MGPAAVERENMMATFIWTCLAVVAMMAIFACCVVAVTVGIRFLERIHSKRRRDVPT